MIPYTLTQLMFFFFVYCFIGWIIESTWVSLHQKRFVNRGLMRGPFIPIYGSGAMVLLLTGTPLQKWPVAVFFAGMVAASILEYFTGMAMEAIFKVRYWDYSDKPFNINGHICLFTSVCWGVLACLENYLLHRPIEALCKAMTLKELNLIVTVVAAYFISDLSLSIKAALDLRDIIIKLENAKEEMLIMQKRLDVILAYANADREAFVDDTLERAEDIAKNIESKFEELVKAVEEKPQEFADGIKDELRELRDKYAFTKANRFNLSSVKGFYSRGLISGNPEMVSRKFKDTFDSLKESVLEKKAK